MTKKTEIKIGMRKNLSQEKVIEEVLEAGRRLWAQRDLEKVPNVTLQEAIDASGMPRSSSYRAFRTEGGNQMANFHAEMLRSEAALGGEGVSMKLFVWTDILCDYTCGVAAVMAPTVEEAREYFANLENEWDAEMVSKEIVGPPTHVFEGVGGAHCWGGA